jgi:RNA polymerase sigma-70 factor (ECF subfamily)
MPVQLEQVIAHASSAERVRDVLAAYESNERDLFSFALAVTREPAVAEDLVQEAFLRLIREARTGRFPDNARAWLYRVVVNLARSRARRRFVADRWRGFFANRDLGQSPEDDFVNKERGVALHRALAALPTEARMALLLATDGHSGTEVATLMGRSEGATRTLLWRARRELRERMATEVGA